MSASPPTTPPAAAAPPPGAPAAAAAPAAPVIPNSPAPALPPAGRSDVVAPLGPGIGGPVGHGAQGSLPGHVMGMPHVDPGEGTVTLTIDGRNVTVPKGTNVLMAARGMGIDVPYFCYHPGLSIAAACRQCLVEVAGQPKLAPSCQVTCADKMDVKTQSPKAVLARQQQLEFTLVNHPVDCPICDKAGECTLQRLYFDHDGAPSRIDIDKVEKPKAVKLGPGVTLDAERCILCSRCVRVCAEVAQEPQLTFANRGDREVLTTAPGHELDNDYSLNVVDVCPVGALTSTDFRFTMRAWELYPTQSVCTGCSTGCNIEIHHAQNRIWRLVPRENLAVNKYWMCDEGRVTYKPVHVGRVASAWHGGAPLAWDKALDTAKTKLEELLGGDRTKLGVVLSAQATNEDNYLLAKLAFDFLGLSRVYLAGRAAATGRADKILKSDDVNPNSAGARLLGRGKAGGVAELEKDLEAGVLGGLIVLDHEVPLSERALVRIGGLAVTVVLASHRQGLSELDASVVLPVASWAESNGTMTNDKGLTQRLRAAFPAPGDARARWEAVAALAGALGMPVAAKSARALFLEMKAAVPELGAAEWGREQPLVQLRFAGSRG